MGVFKRSKNKIERMKNEYDQYLKFLEKENPQIYKKKEKIFGYTEEESKKTPQQKMKMNPFYWYHQFKKTAVNIFTPNENYKLLDKANTDIESSTSKPSKIPEIIKKPFVMVIDGIKYIIKKVSFGYIDLLSPRRDLTIKTTIKYYIVKVKSNTYSLAMISKKKIMTFMSKYQNKEDYDKFAKSQKLVDKMIDENSKKSKGLLKNNRFYQTISYLMSNKFSIFNKYVNSSYFRKKYYELKYLDMNDFKKSPFKKFSNKVFNFFSFKRIINENSAKLKIKMIIVKIIIIYSIYILLKLFYYKLQNRYIDGQYKETMRLIRELKAQNEEILKNNQLIMDENIRLKNKK